MSKMINPSTKTFPDRIPENKPTGEVH